MNQLEARTAAQLDELIGELAEDFAQRLLRGERPTVEEYAAQHPEAAEALRLILPALEIMGAMSVTEQHDARDPLGTADLGPPASRLQPQDSHSATLGDFGLLRELGRGGMGVVYEAEQLSLGRRVALKVLPFAAMLDKQQLARFKNEARAAATLDHPNIVQVYSVGVERGVHYYAMHLVEGESLAQVIARLRKELGGKNAELGMRSAELAETAPHNRARSDLPTPSPSEGRAGEGGEVGTRSAPFPSDHSAIRNPQSDIPTAVAALSTLHAPCSSLPAQGSREYFRTVAQLGIQAAEALDHAHQNGILHRDVKPANLLVDGDGKLWVTDFGLARIEQDAGMTMTGDLLGTLRYMSPEQALAKRVVVDHRSDVYSLGATLYELLTLQPPFETDDRHDLLRKIAFEDPRRPRQVAPHIPSDLETIVAKALEKNPADRFATAQEFAEDLRRYLQDQPIKAKPATHLQQLTKWSRRHIAIVWTALTASLAALGILAVSAAFIARSRNEADEQRSIATKERDQAVSQRELAQQNQYYAEIVTGQADLDQRNIARLNQKLIRYLPVEGEQDYRGWEWYYLYTFCHPESRTLYFPYQRTFASWSPDGELIAAAGVIWKAATGECVRYLTPSVLLNMEVAWSPDSQKLAWATVDDDNAVYVWDRQEDLIRALRGHKDSVWCVAFSPDGKQLASGSLDDSVKIWDVKSKTELRTISPGGDATDVSWSPDGKFLAVGLYGNGLRIYSAETFDVAAQRDEPSQPRVRVSWRPDGRQLAVNTSRHWYILDRSDWSVILDHEHSGGTNMPSDGGDIEWNLSGSQIAFSEKQLVTVWDPEADQTVRTLAGHVNPVNSLSWSPDGRQLVTTDAFQEVRVWDVQRPLQPPRISTDGSLARLSWEADSDTLVSVSAAEVSSTYWSGRDGTRIKEAKSAINSGADSGNLSPDGRYLAQRSSDADGTTIVVRDASSGAVSAVWRPQESFKPVEYDWSPDGSKLAITIGSPTYRGLECWDVGKEQTISRWTSPKSHLDWDDHLTLPTWAPDGSRIAVRAWGDAGDNGLYSYSSHVHIFEVASGRRTFKRAFGNRPRFGGTITAIAWSADTRRLALGSSEGRIDLIKLDAQNAAVPIKVYDDSITALQWSPDGRRLAAAGANGDVKLIESLRGSELLTFHVAPVAVSHVAWSPDGQRLAAATEEGDIHIWDASRAYEFSTGGKRAGELAWAYLQLADEGAGDDIEKALEKSVERAPRELGFRVLRGAALARLRKYDDAAKEFGAAIPARTEQGLAMAVMREFALLGAGDLDAFRELHTKLVRGLDDANASDGAKIYGAGGVAALAPNATDGFEENLAVVKDALAKTVSADEGGLDPMLVLPCGAMQYRLGLYDDAISTLSAITSRLVDAQDQNGQYDLTCAKYFLAMARSQLGHEAPAQRLFADAREQDDVLQSDPNLRWTNRVALDALRREARLMIEP